MTMRERILTAARGGMPDWVPWTTYTGVCGNTRLRQEMQKKGLGLVNICRVFTTEYPDVETTSEKYTEAGIEFRVNTMKTPVGALTQRTRLDSGYGSTWTIEHYVKQPEDYRVLDFILRNAVFRPDYEPFVKADREIAQAGVVFTGVERAPLQRLWIEWTGMERLSVDLLECPAIVQAVLETMEARDRESWSIVADSPAEFIWCPDNISGEMTGPRWFEKYCVPHYEAICSVMHAKGKRVMVHMDGMMRRLVGQVRDLPIDIVEAFTPTPDGDLPLPEARRAWSNKVLWINFPSSVHIRPANEIRQVALQILKDAAPGDAFLVGVTENIPDFAQATTLTAITGTVAKFGKCPVTLA